MTGVITGFGIIASIVALGYVLGRANVLGDHGREVLSRLAFYVATPALLFHILAAADLSVLVSPTLLISALSMAVVASLYGAVGALRRWGVGPTTIGALCASYVNAGNLGIPIASYVLGDASIIAPVLLFQAVITPFVLPLLDLSRPREQRASKLRTIAALPLRNPIILGSVSGIAIAASGWTVPEAAMEPFVLVGGLAVPAVLLAFGISLRGSGLPGKGPERAQVLLSAGMKALLQPLIAWALGRFVFDLDATTLFTVVVIAALPAAQNLFAYASAYRTGVALARESILLSTIAAVPVVAATALLLG